jgi:hypothetical protein
VRGMGPNRSLAGTLGQGALPGNAMWICSGPQDGLPDKSGCGTMEKDMIDAMNFMFNGEGEHGDSLNLVDWESGTHKKKIQEVLTSGHKTKLPTEMSWRQISGGVGNKEKASFEFGGGR